MSERRSDSDSSSAIGAATWDGLLGAHRRQEHQHRLHDNGNPGPLPVHDPVAAVLCCSDARVPPSVIFDQPAGRLFVVRIAGNTAGPAALASLDYAVSHLGVDLLVVLGHTGCGAVDAALAGNCGGSLAPIIEPICRLADNLPGATAEEIVAANVATTVGELSAHPGSVGQAVRAGRLTVKGAVHDLRFGHLETIDGTRTDQADQPMTSEAT